MAAMGSLVRTQSPRRVTNNRQRGKFAIGLAAAELQMRRHMSKLLTEVANSMLLHSHSGVFKQTRQLSQRRARTPIVCVSNR